MSHWSAQCDKPGSVVISGTNRCDATQVGRVFVLQPDLNELVSFLEVQNFMFKYYVYNLQALPV